MAYTKLLTLSLENIADEIERQTFGFLLGMIASKIWN